MRLLAPIVVPLLGLLLNLALTASALAQDAAVALEGTHDAGGTIRFTIAAGGGSLTALEIEGIAGGGCSWDIIDLQNWGGSIPFADGAFHATNADGDSISGQFVDASRIEGTVAVSDPVKGCQTPPLRWVAVVQHGF
jgi:hypothetical protein